MKNLKIEHNEAGICRLSLCGGRGNPLTPELLEELNSTLDELINSPPGVLILDAAGAKIFSGGFALPVIASWPRDRMRSFFGLFLSCVEKLLLLPCPTISAIEGHAIAGGFILSLGTDLRIVGSAKLKFGLSEVDLGVAVPSGARVLLGLRTSAQTALKLSMSARLFGPEEAVRNGFADESVDEPLSRAMEIAAFLNAKPGNGAGVTRALAGAEIWSAMKEADDRDLEDFLDTWYSSEAQACIHALAEKLSGGKK